MACMVMGLESFLRGCWVCALQARTIESIMLASLTVQGLGVCVLSLPSALRGQEMHGFLGIVVYASL